MTSHAKHKSTQKISPYYCIASAQAPPPWYNKSDKRLCSWNETSDKKRYPPFLW